MDQTIGRHLINPLLCPSFGSAPLFREPNSHLSLEDKIEGFSQETFLVQMKAKNYESGRLILRWLAQAGCEGVVTFTISSCFNPP